MEFIRKLHLILDNPPFLINSTEIFQFCHLLSVNFNFSPPPPIVSFLILTFTRFCPFFPFLSFSLLLFHPLHHSSILRFQLTLLFSLSFWLFILSNFFISHPFPFCEFNLFQLSLSSIFSLFFLLNPFPLKWYLTPSLLYSSPIPPTPLPHTHTAIPSSPPLPSTPPLCYFI